MVIYSEQVCFLHSILSIPLHGSASLAMKSTRQLVVREILRVGIPIWDCVLDSRVSAFTIYKISMYIALYIPLRFICIRFTINILLYLDDLLMFLLEVAIFFLCL